MDSRFRTFPISEALALEPELQRMGLKVPASQIDGTSAGTGKCLSDAMVSVGPAGRGGTGSFVSADGLIITNHHVAADAVRQASTPEHDYLEDGFVARSRDQELAGPDYEVWITRSCEDVSAQVLEVAQSEADPLLRANKVRDRKQTIAREREAAANSAASMRCDVMEMFANKTYTLFTYERLRDSAPRYPPPCPPAALPASRLSRRAAAVRIVYVPPHSLGNFGGDEDNFEWPRHSADFTLLRAYVAPDGSASEPSAANVPYQPTSFIRLGAEGAQPGDFVFLLGFPGHTMRYAPACRLAYADEVAVPGDLADFGVKLRLISAHRTASREVALKLEGARRSLANEQKRSAGKRLMMRKLALVDERRAEEAALVAAAAEAAAPLAKLDAVYTSLRAAAPLDHALEALRGVYHGSALLAVSHA